MKTEFNALNHLLKQGYLKENITQSDVVIDSFEKYKELFKKSKGSYSEIQNGWCFFYTTGCANIKTTKGILHSVKSGLKNFTSAEFQSLSKK